MKNNFSFLFLLLLCNTESFAQNFQYSRKLEVKNAGWNKIFLPAEMESTCRPDFADLRILAIKGNGDTAEAPYAFYNNNYEEVSKKTPLHILNPTHSKGSYYYTFEQKEKQNLKEIELSFKQKNFEYFITLEGSHDEKQWFTLLKDYRILSIHNNITEYTFTTLSFSESSYPFYRLQVPSNVDPGLLSAFMNIDGANNEATQKINISSSQTEINKQSKQTIVTLTLEKEFPVTNLKVFSSFRGDYLRSSTVYKVAQGYDSVLQPGNKYEPVINLVLSSLGTNSFDIPKIKSKQIRIVVNNDDNEPLTIDSIHLSTRLTGIKVQLPEAKEYLMVYGDKNASMPNYDAAEILRQTNPVMHTSFTIGNEESFKKAGTDKPGHWFENDLYLYALMAGVIALLGYFSIVMMRKKQ
ncbi:MAG: hypothetical protein MUE99_07820 [Chitinophagaceae bacterium]|nr:hypothetical protein [Chitinophagaceae bacterium]